MNTRQALALLALASLAAVGCDKGGGGGAGGGTGTTSGAAKNIDMAAAKEAYESRCSSCHGVAGKGDGAGAAALTPKPRNFTDAAWNKSVNDDHLRKVIVMGGAAVGKSPIMPAAPDLDSKPEVVDGIIKMVRQFGGQLARAPPAAVPPGGYHEDVVRRCRLCARAVGL